MFNYDPANVHRLLQEFPLLPLLGSVVYVYGRAIFSMLRGVPHRELNIYIRAPSRETLYELRVAVEFLEGRVVSDGDGHLNFYLRDWMVSIRSGQHDIREEVARSRVGTCGFYWNITEGVMASAHGHQALAFGANILPLGALTEVESGQIASDFDLYIPVAMPGFDASALVSAASPEIHGHHILGLDTSQGCYCGITAKAIV